MERGTLNLDPIHEIKIDNAIKAERQGDRVIILRKLESPFFGYDYKNGEKEFVEFTYEIEDHWISGDMHHFSAYLERDIDLNLSLFQQFGE